MLESQALENAMTLDRRTVLLAAVGLPAGCAVQSLAPLPVTPIPAPARPGSIRAPLVGQSWTYRKLNFFNSSDLGLVQETVASVAPTIDIHRQAQGGATLFDEKHLTWGQLSRDPVWDYPMSFEAPVPLWPAPLSVGETTTVNTHYRMDGGSIRFWIQVRSVVRRWERITVAAGTFDSLRIERLIRLDHQDHTRARTERQDTLWLSPEVGRWVARDTSGEYVVQGGGRMMANDAREDHFRWELTAWR
jgi:hypothetical protein